MQMHTIPEAFTCATIAGLWPNIFWKSNIAKVFYKFFTFFTIVVMFTLIIFQIIGMVYLVKSMDELAESLYIFLTGFNSCIKCVNILVRRKKYIELANMMLENKCIPKDKEEEKISAFFNKYSRIMTIFCFSFAEFTAGCIAIAPLFLIQEKYTLAVRAWYPYDIKKGHTFWPTFIHQALGLLIMAAWNTSNDVIAVGFMLQICSQLRLMSYRLEKLPEIVNNSRYLPEESIRQAEREVIEQCVSHHLYILKILKKFESTFAPNILSQYCLSGFTVCLTIYELTVNSSNTAMLIIVSIYLSTMLIELSLYCYFGNEVTVKSMQINDSIYKGDWSKLHPRTIKCLLIIMSRANSPIIVTCGPLITLSNAAYMSVLKVSYSVFNVLRQFQ